MILFVVLYFFYKMTQSQSHGFIFENLIRKIIFKIPEITNDTNIHDIVVDNETLSIKSCLIKNETFNVECGDILRFLSSFDNKTRMKHYMLIICYTQSNNFKNIKRSIEIELNEMLKEKLFGINFDYEKLYNFIQKVKKQPSGSLSKKIKNELYKEAKELQIAFGMTLSIRVKLDSKKQRRVQCCISKMNLFLAENPIFIIKDNQCAEFRNIKYPETIISPSRKRNPNYEVITKKEFLSLCKLYQIFQ